MKTGLNNTTGSHLAERSSCNTYVKAHRSALHNCLFYKTNLHLCSYILVNTEMMICFENKQYLVAEEKKK